ncbi:AraC family transcriptional regulator [Clostridium perfringens]|uniref:AraC family transcriptional regulator n=1 Tax=Clostridium perfringens TaxID=1502 RepID=UPI002246AEB6|nr:AraC family transcriptional regulator [Clostridium perfringens]MCX0392006.1 AraC family transcriptional regulator [Clostridium perfringens]
MDRFDRQLELADGIETEYLRILYYTFDKNYKDTYKSYEYKRLCTIVDGEENVRINNGDNITYDSSKYMLLPPNSSVEMKIEKPTKALVLELNENLISTVSEKLSYELDVDLNKSILEKPFFNENNELIELTTKRIVETATKDTNNKEFLLDLYAQEITYSLLNTKGAKDIIASDFNNPINRSIQIMKGNLKNNITVSEIAYTLNMSLPSFSSKFKKAMGMTPNDYLTNLKLNEAARLLKFSSVTEIAYDLGYENISHFIKLFKKKFGLTPKQYSLKYSGEVIQIQ